MRTVTVRWEPAERRFVAQGTHEAFPIPVNAPAAPGEERAPTGFSPTELLLAGAGACSAWDVVEIVRKQRLAVDAVEVVVTGEQAPAPPWQYERLTLRYTITGRNLVRDAVERAVRLSCDRYCSVLATVRGVSAVETTLDVVDIATGERTTGPVEIQPVATAGTAGVED